MVLLLVCVPRMAQAQKWAVSTNALSWANVGTINAEGSLSVHRNFTLHAGFTANPWKITTPTYVEVMNRQYGGYVGARYWPWHVYSEWWVGVKAQYKNFRQVGLLTPEPVAGDALGAGLAGGYTFMITPHFNLDFGLGFWGGRLLNYEDAAGTGARNFIFLDNVIVSLVYVF